MMIILQSYFSTDAFHFSFFLLQRVWTVWTKIMGVHTSVGKRPKVGLPVNVGLALNLPKTRRTANVGRWRLSFKCPQMSYFLHYCCFPEVKKSTLFWTKVIYDFSNVSFLSTFYLGLEKRDWITELKQWAF